VIVANNEEGAILLNPVTTLADQRISGIFVN